MRRILDHDQMMLLCDRMNGIHIAGLSCQMHRNNRFGLIRDLAPDVLRIDIVRLRINVCKNRRSAAVQHTVGGCRKRDRRGDYLIPRSDSRRMACRMQCRRAFYGANDTGIALAKELYSYAVSQPEIPDAAMAFSDDKVTAYVDGNIQRTKEVTFQADSRQSITMKLPKGVKFHNVSTGKISNAGNEEKAIQIAQQKLEQCEREGKKKPSQMCCCFGFGF